MGILYQLRFKSGKLYIGITRKTSTHRYERHRISSCFGSEYQVHRAWCKYGAPTMTILAVVEDYMLEETESRAVEVFGTLMPNGYNMIPGGASNPMPSGSKHTQKTRNKISLATIGKNMGESNPSKRPEVRIKIAKSKKGKKRPDMIGENNPVHKPGVVDKISKALCGDNNPMHVLEIRDRMTATKRLPENREAMAVMTRERVKAYGKNNPLLRPEVIAKSAASRRGENNPSKRPEVKEKLSVAMSGESNPSKRPEVRAKLTLAMLRRWKRGDFHR